MITIMSLVEDGGEHAPRVEQFLVSSERSRSHEPQGDPSKTSQLYIGGWTEAFDRSRNDRRDHASTEEVMGQIPAGGAADVDAAVDAALVLRRPWRSHREYGLHPAPRSACDLGGLRRRKSPR